MIKVSVIVPVYNAKDYLKRCLDSLVNQTLKDVEIICVDDCSKDNSREILKEYQNKYPQIKIICHKENKGESAARNTGLEAACGKYIAFCDNDDTVELDFYEKLFNRASETDADIVKADVKTYGLDGKIQNGVLNNKILKTKNKWDFSFEWWCAIYLRDMILKNNIRLPQGYVLGGDVYFLHFAIEHCKKLEIINDTFYHWRRREGSGESEVLSYKKVKSALELFDKILSNTNKMYSDLKIDCETYKNLLSNCFSVAIKYIFRNDDIESKKMCIEYFIKFINKCIVKNAVYECLNEEYPLFLEFCNNTNKDEILNFALKIKSIEQFEAKNMFMRLRKKVKQNA